MSLLLTACDVICDAIEAHPSFWTAPAVPVHNIFRADHLRELLLGLGTRQISALLTIKEARAADPGYDGRMFPVTFRLFLLENVALNQMGKSVEDLAEAAATHLAGRRIGDGDFSDDELPLEFFGIEGLPREAFPLQTPDDGAYAVFAVDWTTSLKLEAPPSTTDTPVITEGAGSLTITVAGAAATIRYTTDGTAPTITSALYSGPVATPASGTLIARAWRTGECASLLAEWSA